MQNKKDYPENWTDVIRPRILIRDNYKCVQCGIKHRSYVIIDQSRKRIIIDRDEHEEYKRAGWNTYRIYLQVSHKNHVKSDCSDENLWTLCPHCHQAYDKQHKHIMRIADTAIDYTTCDVGNCPYAYVPHEHSPSGAIVQFIW